MLFRIEVREKKGFFDALGDSVKKDIHDLGFGKKVSDVKTVQVYLLDGALSADDARRIARELLADPITQEYTCNGKKGAARRGKIVEVAYNPGVMDPVEESTLKAIRDLGVTGVRTVKTAKKYIIRGRVSFKEIHAIAAKCLYNKVIQHLVIGRSTIPPDEPPYTFSLRIVPLIRASDARLEEISKKGQLFLSLEEMRAIRDYFKKMKREPTDCEVETIAQTWSEHCKHKTFRGLIEYEGKTIRNLLKMTVMRVTEELKKDWCISVFKDNAGIIKFDDRFNVCFKVETHNHPSALEPYGGAGTGIGGVIRDPLGTGLGAKPILNTDVFCFGPPDHPFEKLPHGALHPKRIMKGVVAGVRDYGNRMGIPTANGAVLFDEHYVGNPLVFCGNVGIMPKEKSFKHGKTGDLIVVVGGRTGRDGIHGATFSSGELTHESHGVSGSAVQIGNPIQEKKVTDTLLQARDLDLYDAITDCGAGGLSSAIGEMGEELGAEVHLERVPLKYKGLRYDEIWISEAQERMVLSVDPAKIDRLLKVFAREDVEATIIGKFTADKRLKLFYQGTVVCDMAMDFIHNGLPEIRRKAVWQKPFHKEPSLAAKKDYSRDLLRLLATPTVASKEWIIRQYDHEVQGASVIKPLQGRYADGPGDACVVAPVFGSRKGLIVSCGINPDFGKIDPYWMAASVIDEALRQVVATGGDIARAAILDNFCWGNTNKPDRLGGLVRAALACYDIAKGYGVPFISGKDSLNNEYAVHGKSISIPPTLLISCIAITDDVTKTLTMDAKHAGGAVYLVGLTRDELGGSQYYKMLGYTGNAVPHVDTKYGKSLMRALSAAIASGCVAACHDCSDGGMAVALAEMAFAGGYGMRIDLQEKTMPDAQQRLDAIRLLFAESNTRFIVEVSNEATFKKMMKGVPVWRLGVIDKKPRFEISDARGKKLIATDIDTLKTAWKSPFKDY